MSDFRGWMTQTGLYEGNQTPGWFYFLCIISHSFTASCLTQIWHCAFELYCLVVYRDEQTLWLVMRRWGLHTKIYLSISFFNRSRYIRNLTVTNFGDTGAIRCSYPHKCHQTLKDTSEHRWSNTTPTHLVQFQLAVFLACPACHSLSHFLCHCTSNF